MERGGKGQSPGRSWRMVLQGKQVGSQKQLTGGWLLGSSHAKAWERTWLGLARKRKQEVVRLDMDIPRQVQSSSAHTDMHTCQINLLEFLLGRIHTYLSGQPVSQPQRPTPGRAHLMAPISLDLCVLLVSLSEECLLSL